MGGKTFELKTFILVLIYINEENKEYMATPIPQTHHNRSMFYSVPAASLGWENPEHALPTHFILYALGLSLEPNQDGGFQDCLRGMP